MGTGKAGIEPVKANKQDTVAGEAVDAVMTPKQAREQAVADGRPDRLYAHIAQMLCPCSNNYKFCKKEAASVRIGKYISPSYRFLNQKCYKCGATRQEGV